MKSRNLNAFVPGMILGLLLVGCTRDQHNQQPRDQMTTNDETSQNDESNAQQNNANQPNNMANNENATGSNAAENSGTQQGSTTQQGQPLAANSLPEGLSSAEILSRIHHSNEMEIQMAKLVSERSATKSVKSFGQTLQKDHTSADKKVTDLAKKENVTLSDPTAMNETEKQKMKEHDDLMNHLQSLKGVEFDKAFIMGAKNMHADAIALLEAANPKDEDVSKLVSELLPTLRNHEREAQAITQQLNFK